MPNLKAIHWTDKQLDDLAIPTPAEIERAATSWADERGSPQLQAIVEAQPDEEENENG